MTLNRRHFLYLLGASALALNSLPTKVLAQAEGPFQLPPLPYDYNALEPYIDEETMRFHHDKHHAAYTNNLNAAINSYPQFKTESAENLLRNLNNLPDEIRKTVRNNGGGYVNHNMFWEIMSPEGGGEPTGAIAPVIIETFGSFAQFQEEFNNQGKGQFGSGWVWLVLDKNKKLQIIATPNQDSPLLQGLEPIMGNDVWEHAYYLKYKNDRGQYLSQWWNVVNWPEINRRYELAMAS